MAFSLSGPVVLWSQQIKSLALPTSSLWQCWRGCLRLSVCDPDTVLSVWEAGCLLSSVQGAYPPHKTKGCSRLHLKVFLSNKHPGHWHAKIDKIGAHCENKVIVLSRGRSCRLFKDCLLLRNHKAEEVASASFSSLTFLCSFALKMLFRLQQLLIHPCAPLALHLRNQPG